MSLSMKRAFTVIGITFALLFIAIGFTLRAAFKDHEPMIDPAYYRKGVNYAARTQALRQAHAEGWRLSGSVFDRSSVVGPRLKGQVLMAVPSGKRVTGLTLVARLERRATVRGRVIVKRGPTDFVQQGRAYATNLDLPVPGSGRWELIIEVTANNNRTVIRRASVQGR